MKYDTIKPSHRLTSLCVLTITLILVGCILTYTEVRVKAQSGIDDIQREIESRNSRIQVLEQEIQQYQKELDIVGKEKQTLETTVRTLDLSRQQLSTSIKVTENRIDAADATLKELSSEIETRNNQIERGREVIADALMFRYKADSNSIVEYILAKDTLADVWEGVDALVQFQSSIKTHIADLQGLREDLEKAHVESESKRNQLAALRRNLANEKSALDAARREKDALLKDTKNKEENYQKIIADKTKARQQFEQELARYEVELRYALDPTKIPAIGSGVLAWPFDLDYMAKCESYKKTLGNIRCVTQMFGNTSFAKSGAYNGKGHNGIDFRAPYGTRITSALSGTVRGVGNTDLVRGCYSYGQWVLVDHRNGLSSLYAHLSSTSVRTGESIGTGDTVGFSGMTGYATGPHLHFSVFATDGVKIVTLGSHTGQKTPCARATMPVAGFEAYLDPLQYL